LIGILVKTSTMQALSAYIIPVLLVTVATLVVSMAAGILLSLRRDVDLIAGAFTLSGIAKGAIVPFPLIAIAYALIGWQAGVRFTMTRLKQVGRTLPATTALIILVNLICASLGYLLADLTGVGNYDGHLATVPGGIYAALALAI
jgi:uncharacterized membrane protein AbrB (regulator of aidB expression)